MALSLVASLAACGGNSDSHPKRGAAALRSPDAGRQSSGEALFIYIGEGKYLVRVTASELVANKTHEVRFYSGSNCTTEVEFLSATDVTAKVDDPVSKVGWRLTAPVDVIATGSSGSGQIEFTVESPPSESAIWRSTIVAVVGPIHPDPGYSGGTLPLACGPLAWSSQ